MSAASLLLQGPFERLSSFSLVNRRLVAELRERHWSVTVFPTDGAASRTPSADPPDVYLFHGHPYDAQSAPGRVNVFFLSYDYARFTDEDRGLAAAINRNFDLVITPSRASRAACRRSGVTRPIAVCPYGVDAGEFHPDVPPRRVPARRRVCFLALGGAMDRKGTDILLKAYAREFTDRDDVTLLIKAFTYRHLRPWAEQQIDRTRRRGLAPHIVYDRTEPETVAGYFTAADMGVFPFRGEGFGLPILECLASGRPAIVTKSGGPLDYARRGVHWLKATSRKARGRDLMEPDVNHLRRLMRAAAERGPLQDDERRRIAASVSRLTWQAAADTMDRLLREAHRRKRTRAPRERASTAYVFLEHGATSWRYHSTQIHRALADRSTRHVSVSVRHQRRPPSASTLIGQSGFCLEAFLAANGGTRRILHRESAPLATMTAITNRERRRCGLPALPTAPMALWRDRLEPRLADAIVVISGLSWEFYRRAGYPAGKLHVIWPGIGPAPLTRRGPRRTTRFLFVASDPFRKGIRVLFDAWARLRSPAIELWCVCPADTLASPWVLQRLVADSRISIKPFSAKRAFLRLYAECDVNVLPSFEDGFPAAIADGMARGVPSLVSTTSGIHEAMESDVNGLVTPSGDPEALAAAMDTLATDAALRRRIGDAGRERSRTITWHDFRQRWRALVDEVESA